MPSITVEVADLWKQGPILPVVLKPVRAAQAWLEEKGRPVPEGILAQAMIDTGARRSFVKNGLLAPLGLPPVSLVNLNTASDRQVMCPLHAVRIGFTMGSAGHEIDISVVEGPEDGLIDDTISMLIGRDVLRHGLLFYGGSDGQFTLSF